MVRRSLSTLFAALLLCGGIAVLAPAAGAAKTPDLPTYSDADCEEILAIGSDSSGSGSSAKQSRDDLRVAGEEYLDTSDDISDKKLSAALKTVGTLYVKASKSKNDTVAATYLLASGGKAYGKALGVVLSATMSCAFSGLSDVTLPGVTVPKSK